MKEIVDFGDVIIVKKEDFLSRIKAVRPNVVSELEEELKNIEVFKYYFEKNNIGQLNIVEHSLDSRNNIINNTKNGDLSKLNNKTAFHLLSLDLATLIKNKELIEQNNIDTKVKINEQTFISDGDLFKISLKDLYESLNSSNEIYKENLIPIKNILEIDEKSTALLSFHYEDERNSAIMSSNNYKYHYIPNPYSDMVVDLYIGDENMTFFMSDSAYLNDMNEIKRIKKSREADEVNYKLTVEDYKNDKDENFEKTEGFNERIEFNKNYCERFKRFEGNMISILSKNDKFLNKLHFLGNHRDEKRNFLNNYKLIEISENLRSKKENKKKFKPY